MRNACAERGPTSSPILKPALEWPRSSNGSGTSCCLNPDRVGRDGFLRLRFERRGSRTILAQSRFSLPLQAMAPLTLDDGAVYLILLNPPPGAPRADPLFPDTLHQAATT